MVLHIHAKQLRYAALVALALVGLVVAFVDNPGPLKAFLLIPDKVPGRDSAKLLRPAIHIQGKRGALEAKELLASTHAGPTADQACSIKVLMRGTCRVLGSEDYELEGPGIARWDPTMRSFKIEPGKWQLRALSEEFLPASFSVRVRSSQEKIAWVGRAVSTTVTVQSTWNTPIEGATVDWVPLGEQAALIHNRPEWAAAVSSITDVNGSCELELEGLRRGGLSISKAGYDSYYSRFQPDTLGKAVTVALRELSDSRVLPVSVLDSQTGLSVANPWAQSEFVPRRFIADDQGTIGLPIELVGRDEITFGAKGYYPAIYDVSDAGSQPIIHLDRAVEISVTVHSGCSTETLQLVVSPVGQKGLGQKVNPEYPFLKRHELRDGADITIRAPSGQPVDLLLSDERGWSIEARVQTPEWPADPVLVVLTTELGEPLAISASDSSGRLDQFIAEAYIDGTYDHIVMEFAATDGLILLPFPERIGRFYVMKASRAPIYVVPIRDSGHSRSGSLDVTFDGSRIVEVSLVDMTGAPISGFLVQCDDQRRRKAAKQYPDLWGSWPTSHQAWMYAGEPVVSPHRAATTDQNGKVVLQAVPLSRVTLKVEPHPDSTPYQGAYFFSKGRWILEPGTTKESVRIQMERRLFVGIQVVDGINSMGVEKFSLQAVRGGGSGVLEVAGGSWKGWLVPGEEISISAAGYSSSRLMVPSDASRNMIVELYPIADPPLVFFGKDLAGAQLKYRISDSVLDSRNNELVLLRGNAYLVENKGNWVPKVSFPDSGVLHLESIRTNEQSHLFAPGATRIPLPFPPGTMRIQVQ